MAISPQLVPHIQQLIAANKEHLIKSAVTDPNSRDKLLAINKAIVELNTHDPHIAAAWGLGCGGSCLTTPDVGEQVIRTR
jgi:hypothetical protein